VKAGKFTFEDKETFEKFKVFFKRWEGAFKEKIQPVYQNVFKTVREQFKKDDSGSYPWEVEDTKGALKGFSQALTKTVSP
jgi:hypothetical protein